MLDDHLSGRPSLAAVKISSVERGTPADPEQSRAHVRTNHGARPRR